MKGFIIILIGSILIYAAFTNTAGDLIVALTTGQVITPQPGGPAPTTDPPEDFNPEDDENGGAA